MDMAAALAAYPGAFLPPGMMAPPHLAGMPGMGGIFGMPGMPMPPAAPQQGQSRGDKGGGGRGGDRDRGDREGRRQHRKRQDAMDLSDLDARYQSVTDCAGQIGQLARDQHGCRFLQRKFDDEGAPAVAAAFPEIVAEVVDLMVDPFGNYLVQKLLDCCTEEQRLGVLKACAELKPTSTEKVGHDPLEGLPHLISVALNTHGTRAAQKLIETIVTPEQIAVATQALKPGAVLLIKDLNGNHVVQRCLQRLSPEDSQFVYDAAAQHCVEIATHMHGCCVLQRCIDHASEAQKKHLVGEVAQQALTLALDPYGNYVVQYILNLGLSWASLAVMNRLKGSLAELSAQKFSSNVVEKCLKLGEGPLEEARTDLVKELIASPALERLLQDPYGNYVVQSALGVTKGQLHQELVERIRPHMAAIKSSPYGKRIIARSSLLNKSLK